MQAARAASGQAETANAVAEWPPPADVLAQRSYCVECDAVVGDCDHDAHRYLAPISHRLIEGTDPQTWQWKRPGSEQWRQWNPWDSWPKPAPSERDEPVIPLANLLAALERRMDLGGPLEDLVRDSYATDPLRTSRACTRLLDDAERQQLRSPGGILFARLKNLRSK